MANRELQQLVQLLNEAEKDLPALVEATSPFIEAYLQVVFDNAPLRNLFHQGYQQQLAVAFIQAGITDPEQLAQVVKKSYNLLHPEHDYSLLSLNNMKEGEDK